MSAAADRRVAGARLIAAGEGRARVEGVMDFASVAALLVAGDALLKRGGDLVIDLGGVTSANSAGLALLLEWLDLARSRRITLSYLNLPDSLARIAELSNLQSLLPIAVDGP
ncbi:lipid asymmetry maintenance protein MlaB [uncultured Lamprocystis sp.]|uniref:STAS domain-containing protein n=1 Tax=uncultured Lamprocystis sp. TaxID=543132 RepID=UPI0025D58ECD|nr:STAS domain-containing protein [uncultured Lamprocystis sp.]